MMLLLLLLFTKYVLLTSQLYFVEAIEEYKAREIENENCTRYIIASKNQSLSKSSCSPWYYQNDGQCEESNGYIFEWGGISKSDRTNLDTEVLLYDYRQ